ncbi:MAG: hypothetical protein K9H64_07405 [Bacteroidales bacterium]|nr:hypothetical protein [Bacteroidales bacterium]MCF8455632.1 hypothetical protein [Bacteroidales bacterium]
MKNKVFLLFGLVAFVAVFAWQSCELVKVDSPEMDVTSDYTPTYIIKGVITSDGNSQGLEGATINIGEVSITAGTDGNYSYETKTAFANGTVVEVLADGFAKSTSTLNFGSQAPVEYFLDFTLTRELPPSLVNLSEGREIAFDGGVISVPGGNSLIGSTDEIIEITVTPLSPFSTLGNWVGSSLKELKIEPAGAEFQKPITIKFDLPSWFDASVINLYTYNNSSNNWEDLANTVLIDIPNNQMSFELKILPGFLKAVDPNSIEITLDTVLVETAVRYSPNSCDCEGTFDWTGGYYVRKVVLAAGTGSLSELNSLHFFSLNSMPYNASLVAGIYIIPAVPAPGVTVGPCKQMDVDVSRQYREVSGTYDYEGELNKTFTVRYYYAVQMTANEVGCPTWSNCHQGCN